MLPHTATDYSLDSVNRHAKEDCQVFATLPRRRGFANLANRLRSQFGRGMLFAACLGAMANTILAVLQTRPPLQIDQAIIGAVAIQMATFVVCWARTFERSEDECVYASRVMARAKGDDLIPARVDAKSKSSPHEPDLASEPSSAFTLTLLPKAPHAPVVANAIAGKTSDVSISHVRIGVRHDRLLTGGCV